jgi:hypothetical protein
MQKSQKKKENSEAMLQELPASSYSLIAIKFSLCFIFLFPTKLLVNTAILNWPIGYMKI